MKRWLVIDPDGIRHHVEFEDGAFYGTVNLPLWVQDSLSRGEDGGNGFHFALKQEART